MLVFCGCFVSPTAYGNIAGIDSGVKLIFGVPAAGAVIHPLNIAAAQPLYSGIFTVGSTAGTVSWLTAPSSP